jgi:phage terminase, small subunit|nr:MAG TPA: terminase small subunit [Caudoviricetes sp.]
MRIINDNNNSVNEGIEKAIPGPEMPVMIKQSPVLAELWKQFMFTLSEESIGNLTLADSWALEMLIRHLHIIRVASNDIVEAGTVNVHDGGHNRLAKNPAESTMRFHSGAAMNILKELRLTPKTRAGKRSDDEEYNPFIA